MVQIIERNDIGERIGRSIGEGLSESVPRQIKNRRLSQTIEDLEKQDLTPLQQLGQLYKSGFNEQQIAQIQPYLRNAAIAGKGQSPSQGKITKAGNAQPQFAPQEQQEPMTAQLTRGGQPQMTRGGQPQKATTSAAQGEPTISIREKRGEEAAQRPIRTASPDEIDNRARQLMNEHPELYQGENAYPHALARAEQELNFPALQQQQDIESLQRQAGIEQGLKNKVKEKILDKGISLERLTPEVAQRFQKKADYLFKKEGLTEEQAAEKVTKDMKDLDKTMVTLANNIGTRPLFGEAPKELIKDLNNMRRQFEKHGELELFKDSIKHYQDIGDHLSSQIAYPIQPNQEEIIRKNSKEDPSVIAAKLAETINDKTSLFSIGYLAGTQGVDDQALINELIELEKNGIFGFDNRQDRESQEYFSLHKEESLGDMLFESMFGLASPVIHSLSEYFGLKKGKVGSVERLKQKFGKE